MYKPAPALPQGKKRQPEKQKPRLVVALHQEELRWFHQIAAASGTTLSALVRHCVAEEGIRLGVPFVGD